jgi:RNA polymerase sigma factor (sigma-70 family)
MERDDMANDPADMAVLTERAARGDRAAWNVIVDRFTPLLWSIARSSRLSEADAADVIQATWLRFIQQLPQIRDPQRIASWLATTARHEALRTQRMHARDDPAEDPWVFDTLPDTGTPPAPDVLIQTERDRDLWRAFNQLSPRCQKVLQVLLSDSRASYAAVGSALGMPVGSIGPTRSRCLAQLRRLLADQSIDEAELQDRLRVRVSVVSAVPERVLDDAQGALADRTDPPPRP